MKRVFLATVLCVVNAVGLCACQGQGASSRIDSVTLNNLNPIVGQTLVASVSPAGATATITWYRDDDKILTYGAAYTVQADDIGHTMYVWAEGTGNTTGSATSRITSEVKAN